MLEMWAPPFAAFPADDIDAAKAWFTDIRNHNFAKWEDIVAVAPEGASGDEHDPVWEGLEGYCCQITRIQTTAFQGSIRTAAAEVLLSEESKTMSSDEDNTAIGTLMAAKIMYLTNTKWKDESATWIRSVCRILAPRAIAIWEKMIIPYREEQERQESQSGGGKRQPEGQKREQPPLAKRLRLIEEQAITIAAVPSRNPLVSWNIILRIERPGYEEAGIPHHRDHVAIAVAAIVDDNARLLDDKDIQATHLSHDKFQNLLQTLDPDSRIDEGSTKSLYHGCKPPEGREDLPYNQAWWPHFQKMISVSHWRAQSDFLLSG
jgi:hypothetical protein